MGKKLTAFQKVYNDRVSVMLREIADRIDDGEIIPIYFDLQVTGEQYKLATTHIVIRFEDKPIFEDK